MTAADSTTALVDEKLIGFSDYAATHFNLTDEKYTIDTTITSPADLSPTYEPPTMEPASWEWRWHYWKQGFLIANLVVWVLNTVRVTLSSAASDKATLVTTVCRVLNSVLATVLEGMLRVTIAIFVALMALLTIEIIRCRIEICFGIRCPKLSTFLMEGLLLAVVIVLELLRIQNS